MTKGYVYILSNAFMPGLVKIGKTTRTVEQRCEELWQTGVPARFAIVNYVETPDCNELEAIMHEHFRDCRVSGGREFFAVDEQVAVDILYDRLRGQVSCIVDEYCPNSLLVDYELALCEVQLYTMAAHLDVDAREAVMAINFLTPDELRPALERYRLRVQERVEARDKGLPLPNIFDETTGASLQ